MSTWSERYDTQKGMVRGTPGRSPRVADGREGPVAREYPATSRGRRGGGRARFPRGRRGRVGPGRGGPAADTLRFPGALEGQLPGLPGEALPVAARAVAQ